MLESGPNEFRMIADSAILSAGLLSQALKIKIEKKISAAIFQNRLDGFVIFIVFYGLTKQRAVKA